MIDHVDDIAVFYGQDPDREHHRLLQHRLEHALTWRHLDRHLPPRGAILDVGAATGRYTLELARRGYAVTAVDLSAPLLDRARSELNQQGSTEAVDFVVADARNLQGVPADTYDAVLMLGPLYHLIEEEDRRTALREARLRMKTDGLIFSAFLSRFGVIGDLMRRVPEWINDEAHVRSFLGQGQRPTSIPRGGFRGYFAVMDEIVPLHESEGFETLDLVGVEPAISAHDESFNTLEGEQRERWLDLLEEISGEPSIVGASRHVLYIGRKR